MPASKFLRKFFSRSPFEGSPRSSSDVTPTVQRGVIPPPKAPTIADPRAPQYSDAMKKAWDAANTEQPKARGVEKFLNSLEKVENAVMPSDAEQAMVQTLVAPVNELVADDIEKVVNTFAETVPILMKALDEVAKVHPFIAVAVTAFKAVYKLEVTRRNNDKRVIAIYAEMRDMMGVLIQLKDVSDPEMVAPSGHTIGGRMQELSASVAHDITRCGNVCDAYRKKRLLAKIFGGFAWELRLVEFVEVFANRRKEFLLALSIHSTVGVGEANFKLGIIDRTTAEINQRMEVMMELFREKFVPLEQRQLAALVKQKGGDAAIHDEQSMKELVTKETSISTLVGSERRRSAKKFDLGEIQREIQSDPAEAIERNEESFNAKFRVQMRQIQEDVERAVRQQGDRIISAVTGGPHERIADPDLRQIWKDMGWRGNVKARHFVLALKDHYAEIIAGGDEGATGSDEWALRFTNVNYVRNIMEAFDEDASGFVTIKEANNFTRSRPQGWSLPHWLAYWAIGWQMTSTSYCKKIENIFDVMIRLSDEVLPENRKGVNEYIWYVWIEVATFTRSIKWEDGTDELREKFQSHVDAEEERLQKNLEDIKYDIDSYDSVHLISHGRIETTLFPMFYLLLQRDLQKISLAREHVLSESELPDALSTIQWITLAARYRMLDLRAIFEQQGPSSKEQFAIHAKGLYRISSDGDGFWGNNRHELPDVIPADREIVPSQDSAPLSVLNHPIGKKHESDFDAYDSLTSTISSSVDGPDAVLGTYHGFVYGGGKPIGPMVKWTLNRGSGDNSLVASGTHYHLGYHRVYTLTGTVGPLEGGKMRVDMKVDYATAWQGITMTGHFDVEENSLRGTTTWGGEFVFKRDPDFVRLYPAPSTIDARARWKFATRVVLDRIRRQSWSPHYILKRIKDGKRYLALTLRWHYGKKLNDDEWAEYYDILPSLFETDARFYVSRLNIRLNRVTIHEVECDSCCATLEGARVICLDCHGNETLDLCSEPECLNSVVTPKRLPDLEAPHTPNHDMLKVHRILFGRDTARTEQNAKDALVAARKTISDLKAEKRPMPACICCRNVVALPCWYCVDCTEGKFICADCEQKCLAFSETHTRKHTVVRVIRRVEESKVSTEERLKAVEGHLGSVEGQLGSVQEELSKMRRLFLKLFEKGTEGFPGDPLTKGDVLDAAMGEPRLGEPLLARGEAMEV